MKKFLLKILAFIGIPMVLLVLLYLIIDPFRMLRPFDLDYFDNTNRDYLSTELFLRNYPSQRYDSYIFGSSRACGINSYHWKKYLPAGANQYVFQGWSESLTGIEQKVTYLDAHDVPIRNALVLFDIPATFRKDQIPTDANQVKDYRFSGQSPVAFHLRMFYNFIQKPSFWMQSVTSRIKGDLPEITFDTISNDWTAHRDQLDLSIRPERDSLKECSEMSRSLFLTQFSQSTTQTVSDVMIDARLEAQLRHIASIFERQGTDFHIIISPAPCYTRMAVNPADLRTLQRIFGASRVHDYSGVSELTNNPYNFSDPDHFGFYVGWQIIEDIFAEKN